MIKEVELEGEVKVLKSEKNEYRGKNVIIATGAHARPIGCKGEGQFRGKGVSYCATCDANFFDHFLFSHTFSHPAAAFSSTFGIRMITVVPSSSSLSMERPYSFPK